MIIGTYRGIVHYRPTATEPPKIEIREVVADQVYPHPGALELTTTGSNLVTIAYHGPSLSTHRMRCSYILEGYNKEWQDTWESQVRYEKLPPGEYTFRVIAINRDLVCSETPATLKLNIVPDPRDEQIAQLESELERRNRELEAELQDAREMQMSLIPNSAPTIEGVEIAGRCVPANTVGGDFFDYLKGKSDNEIGLVIADVTGKGMKGAMNAVMADGILRMAAEEQKQLSPASLLMRTNNVLESRTERYMNVTMAIGVIDALEKTLTIANAGALPILLRDGEILPFELGGFPLGMKAGFEYVEERHQLKSGDVVILMTDGIIETQDDEGRFYSDSGRLEDTLRRFTSGMSAEAMVEAIFDDAISFGGEKAQRDDDMTVVAAKIQ
jgi:serine phosphatase RsbU (regulator of sigma subunit)